MTFAILIAYSIGFGVTMIFLANLQQNLILKISSNQVKFLAQFDNLEKFKTMYSNIDVGIAVLKNGSVDFMNDFMKDLMG